MNIINIDSIMMILFLVFMIGIIAVPAFYFFKHIFLYGSKFEKYMTLGALFSTAIIFIL